MAYFTQKQLAEAAGETALTDQFGTTTWEALDGRVNQLVNALREQGVSTGDAIAVFAGNCREYFEVLLAATHGGLICVPVNWHFSAEELAYVVEDSGAKLVFVEGQFEDVARAAGLDQLVVIRGTDDGYERFLAQGAATEPDDQALGGPMFYTSGTTGRPKGVRSSTFAGGGPLAAMEMMGAGLAGMLAIPPGGRTLLCGPVYHSAQWAFSFLPLIAGSSVVMRHKFDPAEALELIDRHAITNVHLVPTQFHRMLRLDDATRAAFDGSSLSVVWHGAAPCPPQTKRDMIDWWGKVISEYYGSTEGSIVSTTTAEQWLEKPGTVGQPAPIVEVTIRDDDGEVLPQGEHGQIYVKSLMGSDFEYHNAPEKTRDAHLEPGTFTFGDIGYLDEDGFLFLSDRKIDMIISGGVNIYPAEIEGVLAAHDAVQDVAVFGIPNEEFGEEVKAAITVAEGVTPDEALSAALIAHCREHLAGFKAPRSIDFIDEMPRHETGKLYKRKLRDAYWEGRAI